MVRARAASAAGRAESVPFARARLLIVFTWERSDW